jgi:hypothetical protein
LLKVVQPQPQARSSIQEDSVSPHSPVVPQSPVSDVQSESHMVQMPPTEEEVEEDVAGAFDAVEDTGYSAIALYDYQAGEFFLDS